jgi:hypothetical protein
MPPIKCQLLTVKRKMSVIWSSFRTLLTLSLKAKLINRFSATTEGAGVEVNFEYFNNFGTPQAANGWVATDRSVLYVVLNGATSDGGTNGDPLALQSEQLANIGVEVRVIVVGDSVRRCVLQDSFELHIPTHHDSDCVKPCGNDIAV